MGSPSLTKRLLEAARKGQEIVTVNDGSPVTHEARVETDPRPWATASGDHYGAGECFARLALPLPAGTVLEHTVSRKRGLFVGPGPEGLSWLITVEFDGEPMAVGRSIMRRVS